MEISIIGGRLGAPMTYEQFAAQVRATLLGLPDYPREHWAHLGDIEDPVTHELNSIPIDPRNPDSLAAAIATTSRRGDAWKISTFRGRNMRVDASAVDGKRYRIVVDLKLPARDSPEVQEMIHQYMAVLVDVWQPTWLKAGPSEFDRRQGVKGMPNEVFVGWDTHLAPEVQFDTVLLGGAVKVTPRAGGGRYITLAGGPADPDLSQALLVRKALGY